MEHFLDAVYGNERARRLIGRDILDGKQHHAYILEGPTGSGKHLLAQEIAKSLLCRREKPNVLPCGICPLCRKIDALSCTDVLYINSGERATISVETVREALASLAYAPDEGNYKVYIIEDGEKMTVQAQNALLLSLEEPPAYAVFLLLVNDAAALLETIRSRCTIFSMERFSEDALFAYLQKKNSTYSRERLQKAAALSGGCIGAAEIFLSGTDDIAVLADAAEKWVSLLCTGSAAEAFVYCSGIKYTRGEMDIFLQDAMTAVRNRIAAKIGYEEFLFSQGAKQLPDASQNTLSRLSALYDAIYNAWEEIVHANASAYLVLCTLTEKHFFDNLDS